MRRTKRREVTTKGLPYLDQSGEFIKYSIEEIKYLDGYWSTDSEKVTEEMETQFRKDKANIIFTV